MDSDNSVDFFLDFVLFQFIFFNIIAVFSFRSEYLTGNIWCSNLTKTALAEITYQKKYQLLKSNKI